MIAKDPPKPDPVHRTIAVAVVTAALTTLVTKCVEWGVEEAKNRFKKKEAE